MGQVTFQGHFCKFTEINKKLVFTGLIKIVVLEAEGLLPTQRMTRLDTDILQVSSNRLNPYVMVDIYEKGSRGQPIARHLDKTVAMKGNGLKLKKNQSKFR